MCLLLLYLLVAALSRRRGSERVWVTVLGLAFLVIVLVAVAAQAEFSIARLAGILTPLLAARLAICLKQMEAQPI